MFSRSDSLPLLPFGAPPTLTYPGKWETVAPDGASVKRHMVLWRNRFHREVKLSHEVTTDRCARLPGWRSQASDQGWGTLRKHPRTPHQYQTRRSA
jgi:hypothetical protein